MTAGRWFRERRGSAPLFFLMGVGTVLITVTLLFDLIRYVETAGTVERMGKLVADQASRDAEVDCVELRTFAEALHQWMLGSESQAELVMTAVSADPDAVDGFRENWNWSTPHRMGPAGLETLEECRDQFESARNDALAVLNLATGESMVMSQLCVSPDLSVFSVPHWIASRVGLSIYRHHILPIRHSVQQEICP